MYINAILILLYIINNILCINYIQGGTLSGDGGQDGGFEGVEAGERVLRVRAGAVLLREGGVRAERRRADVPLRKD